MLAARRNSAPADGRHSRSRCFRSPTSSISRTRARPRRSSLRSFLDDGGSGVLAWARTRAADAAARHRPARRRGGHGLRETRHVMTWRCSAPNTGRPVAPDSDEHWRATSARRRATWSTDRRLPVLRVPRHASSVKQRVVAPPKYYAIDNGLRRQLVQAQPDVGTGSRTPWRCTCAAHPGTDVRRERGCGNALHHARCRDPGLRRADPTIAAELRACGRRAYGRRAAWSSRSTSRPPRRRRRGDRRSPGGAGWPRSSVPRQMRRLLLTGSKCRGAGRAQHVREMDACRTAMLSRTTRGARLLERDLAAPMPRRGDETRPCATAACRAPGDGRVHAQPTRGFR